MATPIAGCGEDGTDVLKRLRRHAGRRLRDRHGDFGRLPLSTMLTGARGGPGWVLLSHNSRLAWQLDRTRIGRYPVIAVIRQPRWGGLGRRIDAVGGAALRELSTGAPGMTQGSYGRRHAPVSRIRRLCRPADADWAGRRLTGQECLPAGRACFHSHGERRQSVGELTSVESVSRSPAMLSPTCVGADRRDASARHARNEDEPRRGDKLHFTRRVAYDTA